MAEFVLDRQLERDSAPLAELPLCAVRLMRDAAYPWLILVPRRAGAAEIVDLGREERLRLMDEIAATSQALMAAVPCDKLNIGALGNVVRQLHVHVVARRRGDPAWPKPVWGFAPAVPYEPASERTLIAAIAGRLSGEGRTG